jgi:Cys-rich repeat protein
MEADRFDGVAKALAGGIPRRRLLKGLGGALGAAALAVVGRGAGVGAASGGDSASAACCAALFPPGPPRGQCVSAAAHGSGPCVPCRTSADCPTGLVCDAATHVCRGCTGPDECAPVDQLGNRFCVALADGSGQSVCANFLLCTCPGTCAQCGPDQACFGTGGGVCEGKNLCCPPTAAL